MILARDFAALALPALLAGRALIDRSFAQAPVAQLGVDKQ
jgi:hypothetical protein